MRAHSGVLLQALTSCLRNISQSVPVTERSNIAAYGRCTFAVNHIVPRSQWGGLINLYMRRLMFVCMPNHDVGEPRMLPVLRLALQCYQARDPIVPPSCPFLDLVMIGSGRWHMNTKFCHANAFIAHAALPLATFSGVLITGASRGPCSVATCHDRVREA